MPIYNVYCDESCHMENDHQPIMAQGAIWCPTNEAPRLSREVRALKEKHNARGELKWTKVSMSRIEFYIELVNWFIQETSVHFRTLVVLQKYLLDHSKFNENSHETFYYKMYFSLLNKILSPEHSYNIYLDIKDTQSKEKIKNLSIILCNNVYDFTSNMIRHMQNIHSCESDLMQLTDFLLGAVSYKHRNINCNPAKVAVINRLETLLGYSILSSTPLKEDKFNIFLFHPRSAK